MGLHGTIALIDLFVSLCELLSNQIRLKEFEKNGIIASKSYHVILTKNFPDLHSFLSKNEI